MAALPHLLMIPFIWSNSMWQSGAGGSIPSMIAYVFGVVGMFRLVRGVLQDDSRTSPAAVAAASVAALVYAANPNLIYMQATAMTESIYLALFIWAVVYFSEFLRALKKHKEEIGSSTFRTALTRCAACLAGAELTRYDGWFLAGAVGSAVLLLWLRNRDDKAFRRATIRFLAGIALVPILWLAYNRVVYSNAFEFANGPYSAKAIEERVAAPNPALHDIPVAAIYFLKSAQINVANGNWGRFWLFAVIIALAAIIWNRKTQAPLLLLWVPLPFYALSIAYGSVPLHVYTWWPFATFNQRYGLQLLPLFAVSAGMVTAAISALGGKRHGDKIIVVVLSLVVVSYAWVWKAGPQCWHEGKRNWEIRHSLNSAVQRIVESLPPNSTYLMDLGEHVGVMEQAGIPLRHVVNNENHRPWKRPFDPEGLWERALANPSKYVDFVILFDGDVVDQNVNRSQLTQIAEIHAIGQVHAHIFTARSATNPSGDLNQSR